MARPGSDANPARDDDAAIVDRLLRKLHANGPAPEPPPPPRAVSQGGFRPSGLDGRPARRPAPPSLPGPTARDRTGAWARAGLGVLVAVAITRWPYSRACGPALLVYLLAVTTVLSTGLWAAVSAWRLRCASAHVVALGTLLWGLAVTAHEVLPRIGYASASATWRCVAPEAITPTSSPVVDFSATPSGRSAGSFPSQLLLSTPPQN